MLSDDHRLFLLRRAVAAEEANIAARMGDAVRWGLGMQEETLTEMLHLGLARDMIARLAMRAIMFSRVDEGANGADWLWCFRGSTGLDVLMFVQAKRWRKGVGYTFNQSPAPTQASSHDTQRSVLLAAGHACGVRTAYTLYNPDYEMPMLLSNRCEWDGAFSHLGGATLVNARSVEDHLVGARRLGTAYVGVGLSRQISQTYAWPLSCALFCYSHPQHLDPGSTLDVVVSRALTASGVPDPSDATDQPARRDLLSLVSAMTTAALSPRRAAGPDTEAVPQARTDAEAERSNDAAANGDGPDRERDIVIAGGLRRFELAGAVVIAEGLLNG